MKDEDMLFHKDQDNIFHYEWNASKRNMNDKIFIYMIKNCKDVPIFIHWSLCPIRELHVFLAAKHQSYKLDFWLWPKNTVEAEVTRLIRKLSPQLNVVFPGDHSILTFTEFRKIDNRACSFYKSNVNTIVKTLGYKWVDQNRLSIFEWHEVLNILMNKEVLKEDGNDLKKLAFNLADEKEKT